jgi:hypothetical protein
MSWTKRQFVEQALEEIGVASYDFDLQPEQLQSALRTLDAMIASWNANGVRISYPLPSSPENSELDTETNVPDTANEAIYTNLAIRLASRFGKVVSQELKATALQAYSSLLAGYIEVEPRRYGYFLPVGAGNSGYGYNSAFFPNPADQFTVGNDSILR